MKKWLITGGCGFIGTALVRNIIEERPYDQIRVLDNLSHGTRKDLAQVCRFDENTIPVSTNAYLPEPSGSSSAVELIVGDITDIEMAEKAALGMDCIVHLAANTGVGPSVENPRQDLQSNVLGILNMLEGAQKHNVERFVFASSSAPVGETDPPVHEELAPRPVSPYGASKLAGEGYCSAYYRTYGIKTVALRFGNVYGPGSTHKTSVVAKFIKQALRGEPCVIYGDGSQTRDFIYIDDLVQAILKAALFDSAFSISDSSSSNSSPNASGLMNSFSDIYSNIYTQSAESSLQAGKKKPWGENFQIATNMEHTVNELAEMLSKELKNRGVAMRIEYGEPMRGDILRNYSDTSKAKNILGWQYSMNLQQGLAKTVDWFFELIKNKPTSLVL